MAKIQPEEIRSQSFKKGLFGYKAADVDSFKNTIYRAYDEVYRENGQLTEDMEKLNTSLQECRVKIFELESQLENGGGGNASTEEIAKAKKDAAEILAGAKREAAEIIAKAKADANVSEAPKAEEAPKTTFGLKSDEPKKADSSRFFKKEEPVEAPKAAAAADEDDDDEIFVGEIEDARKPDRMMIGDGEEEDADFEFL